MIAHFYNNFLQGSTLSCAFVMKNEMPYAGKVLLFHEKLGKIWCIFNPQKDSAALLHTGSLIRCRLQPKRHQYQFLDLQIESMLHAHHVVFVHDIMRICIKGLDEHVLAPELFDFLCYVFGQLHLFGYLGKTIVLLRIFVMFDYITLDAQTYQIVMSDPLHVDDNDQAYLTDLLQKCWNNFYEKKS